MTLRILRAITSVVAAATGLLLAYGGIYAMESMTTRVPMSQLHEPESAHFGWFRGRFYSASVWRILAR